MTSQRDVVSADAGPPEAVQPSYLAGLNPEQQAAV
jgi:hypothetical protein